jgi:hypothetical protein
MAHRAGRPEGPREVRHDGPLTSRTSSSSEGQQAALTLFCPINSFLPFGSLQIHGRKSVVIFGAEHRSRTGMETIMKRILCVLCLALPPGMAGAQEQHISNFEDCVNESKQNHTDRAADNYSSYKCEGKTAAVLAARPDECEGGRKPPLHSLVAQQRKLEDGLYRRLSWREDLCSGVCETRFYDSKDTTYLCEVRKKTGSSVQPETREVPPPGPESRRPSHVVRRGWRRGHRPRPYYGPPAYYHYRMIEMPPEPREYQRYYYYYRYPCEC